MHSPIHYTGLKQTHGASGIGDSGFRYDHIMKRPVLLLGCTLGCGCWIMSYVTVAGSEYLGMVQSETPAVNKVPQAGTQLCLYK